MFEVCLKLNSTYTNWFGNSQTSMIWPSQNFLLYNGNIIKIKGNEWTINLKDIYNVSPPP